LNSTFRKNYAIKGGIFFTQLDGLVECDKCIMQKNFAVYGGILYSQNEGSATFINCEISKNLALRASMIYSINSLNAIKIYKSVITENGYSNNQGRIDLM
jgi:hypothetical protein